MKIGDKVTLPMPVTRRWWQFWKPRIVRYERRTLVITHVWPPA